MKNNPVAWLRCEGGDDHCQIHHVLTYQCTCPPYEDWLTGGIDPYTERIDAELEQWVIDNSWSDDVL